jgi:hypothetical protein
MALQEARRAGQALLLGIGEEQRHPGAAERRFGELARHFQKDAHPRGIVQSPWRRVSGAVRPQREEADGAEASRYKHARRGDDVPPRQRAEDGADAQEDAPAKHCERRRHPRHDGEALRLRVVVCHQDQVAVSVRRGRDLHHHVDPLMLRSPVQQTLDAAVPAGGGQPREKPQEQERHRGAGAGGVSEGGGEDHPGDGEDGERERKLHQERREAERFDGGLQVGGAQLRYDVPAGARRALGARAAREGDCHRVRARAFCLKTHGIPLPAEAALRKPPFASGRASPAR